MVHYLGSQVVSNLNVSTLAEAGVAPGLLLAPAPPRGRAIVVGARAVERALAGRLPLLEGETYAECLARYREAFEQGHRGGDV
jgi:hypothetical protein